jgi:hypothetical protein
MTRSAFLLTLSLLAAQAHAQHLPLRTPDLKAPKLFDGMPNFSLRPSATAAQSGAWGDPRTWEGGSIPKPTESVLIPPGLKVTVSGTETAKTVAVRGVLSLMSGALTVNTLQVLPDGYLELGKSGQPVTAKLVLGGERLPKADDPEQHGAGLLVLGRLVAVGEQKTSFVRLAAAPSAGASTLALGQAVSGWKVGDKLAIPDTRSPARRGKSASQSETVALSGISPDGTVVTLSTPLKFAHAGQERFLPHVLNLSRSVTVTSKNATVPGHIFLGESASTEIANVAFMGLGRTTTSPLDPDKNHVARYAFHFHHAMGPFVGAWRGKLSGCAFDGSPKWQLVLHGTTKVRAENNAFWGARGAAVVVEDGHEAFNELVGNIAASCPGVTPAEVEPGQRTDKEDVGSEGVGFWLANAANLCTNNIAADCALAGILKFPRPERPLRGTLSYFASPTDEFASRALRFPWADNVPYPVPFANNEVYGSLHGHEFWEESAFTVRDSVAWNCHQGLVPRFTEPMIVDGLIVRGDSGALGDESDPTIGVPNRYYPVTGHLKRLDISGMAIGVKQQTPRGTNEPGGRQFDVLIEDSVFACPVGVRVEGDLHYKRDAVGQSRTLLKNCKFSPLTPNNGGTRAVDMILDFGNDINALAADEVYVESFQGKPGANFRLYYDIQAPSVIVPVATPDSGIHNLPAEQDSARYHDGQEHFRIRGLKEKGLTNAQAWAKYKKAWAGSVAPATAKKHPTLGGLVLPIAASSVPPLFVQPRALTGIQLDGDSSACWGANHDWHLLWVPLELEIRVDGKKIGSVRADQYNATSRRTDGFRFPFPSSVRDGREHEIAVVVAGTNEHLPGSPMRRVLR